MTDDGLNATVPTPTCPRRLLALLSPPAPSGHFDADGDEKQACAEFDPMSDDRLYNPHERMREKQLRREQDDRDLAAGLISKEELSRRNGLFSSLDLSGAKIVRRGRIR